MKARKACAPPPSLFPSVALGVRSRLRLWRHSSSALPYAMPTTMVAGISESRRSMRLMSVTIQKVMSESRLQMTGKRLSGLLYCGGRATRIW